MKRWFLVLAIRAACALSGLGAPAAALGFEQGVETLHHPVPGGVAVVAIDSGDSVAPTATYRDRQVLVIPAGQNRWLAIVGIPLDTPPSTQVQKVRTLRLALRERGHADTDIEEALRYWSEHLQKRRAA